MSSNRAQKKNWEPSVKVPKPENRAAYNAVLAQRADVLRQIGERKRQARKLISAWLAGGANPPRSVPSEGLVVRLRCDEQRGAAGSLEFPRPRRGFAG